MNCADLDKLIEAVDAGSIPRHDLDAFIPVLDLCSATNDALSAYNGSIDAAKALHEALLPGCMWQRQPTGQFNIFDSDADEIGYGVSDNPARAWLLAILKAYRSQVQS